MRRAGQHVTADQYPWSASGTSLSASLVPRWAQDGGRTALLKRFDDASLAGKLRADMADNLRRRGGAASLLITTGPHKASTLADVASMLRARAATTGRDDESKTSTSEPPEGDDHP